ncbi:MBL fold metallo-hydrolase [Streptomyces sp. NPDC020379]|uniref:MBL fold metallo-hydrolase n=1 Tax=Streptomyces sp. NPDC020379 TaxID=3365071 RepID=UPI0037AF3D16
MSDDAAWAAAASDGDLEAVLSAADDADLVMRTLPVRVTPAARAVPDDTCEVTLLGALGCRYGMLSGGAGGLLVRTAGGALIMDPGPAALTRLLKLAAEGEFDFAEVAGIVVTHLHPDHYADLIPCLEGVAMASGRPPLVLVNPTAAERFAAFSPYHQSMGTWIVLAHPETEGDGEPCVKVTDMTVHATPALHLEEAGRSHSAIGLVLETAAGHIWYSSDTNLWPGLLDAVAAIAPRPRLVIVHGDAALLHADDERRAACHLGMRDLPVIARQLAPEMLLVQHYDAAYSSSHYRQAHAEWVRRRTSGDVRVVPGYDGQRIVVSVSGSASVAVRG